MNRPGARPSSLSAKHFLWTMALGLTLSCALPIYAAPQIPTPIPGIVNTIVVQTANAAATQTAALAPPTPTPLPASTPSFTPIPTETPSPFPSPIVTFTFVLSTPTSLSTGDRWDCQVLGQSPMNSTSLPPNYPFAANWTVKNTGNKAWSPNSVDIVFSGGKNMAKASAFDADINAGVGGVAVVTIRMTTPGQSGTYTTRWSLRAGDTRFCPMSLTIVVP